MTRLMPIRTAITWEDFLASAVEGQKCEWIDGEVVQMSPVSLWHEDVLARLIEHLVEYCRAHPEWKWFPSNGAFTMASGNWRLPDASLVRKERFPGGRVTVNRADFAPDVAFEILSPSNSPSYIQRKRKDYQESGVIQVWIDPDLHLVEVMYADRASRYFQENQLLVIDTLSQFSLDLSGLFAM
jgi:Uma2 family endonuclease